MANLKGETVEVNTSPACKEIKDCARLGSTKMRCSPSRLSGKRASESVDSDRRHGSALALENSSKCHESDMQSSSVKSEISTETHLTPWSGSFEMEMRKKRSTAEDGLNTTMQNSQHTTESSCSNSLPVAVPVSFSNQSYQETSKEAYSFRNCGSPMDSSNSKTFDRSPEELVTASSESGVSAQIASKTIRSANVKNSTRVLSVDGNYSSSMINKGDRGVSHKWDHEPATPEDADVLKNTDDAKCFSGKAFSTEDRKPSTVSKISFCSDNSDNFYRTSRIVKDTRMRGVHENLPTFHSEERMVKHEICGGDESVLEMEGKLLEIGSKVMDKHKDEFWVIESSDSSMAKRGKKPVKDQDKAIAGFDLNEDFNANDPDDCVQTVFSSVPSHGVIHVVAKAGIPSGRPLKPLKFEGGLGWKGMAETSAFRPTAPSKNLDGKTSCTDLRPKNPERFTGIDLNVDFVEDLAAANEISLSSPSTIPHSHSEVDGKQVKSPWIDLNCFYDAPEEATQPLVPPKSESSRLVDLNLDTGASLAGRSNNAHWPSQGCQLLGNKTSDFSNPGMRDFSLTGNVYLADLSTMQHLANNAASPHILQSMERVASHALPSHSYSSKGPFHFGSRDPLPSNINLSGAVPYTRYYQEHGPINNSFNNPHLAQFIREQSSSNVSGFVPKLEVKTEDLLSSSGSKIDGGRQFPFLSNVYPMGEPMHQEGWYTASLKRKEPERGYQLGYK